MSSKKVMKIVTNRLSMKPTIRKA